jgi:DNA processing protein
VEVRGDQFQLLTLCAVPKVSWSLIAREAQRPEGVGRLHRGELSESSEQAAETAERLRRSRKTPTSAFYRVQSELAQVPIGSGVRLTTVLDEDYPSNLRGVDNPPPFLFYRGALDPSDARSVAVVGTRQASDEGLRRTRALAGELVKGGITVVSGLARGIDTAAHRATLDASGRTIAVMGTGIMRRYPEENELLADEIGANGALVSQFWPWTPPASNNFPRRNIVTSGLSVATVVVEATSTSGAKNQARRALEHGKPVFLFRDLVTSQEWAKRCVDRGAIEVDHVDDVIGRLRSPEEPGLSAVSAAS